MVLRRRLSGLVHALQLGQVQGFRAHHRLLRLLLTNARSPAHLLRLAGQPPLRIHVKAGKAVHGCIHVWLYPCTEQ